jgi:cholinesterase
MLVGHAKNEQGFYDLVAKSKNTTAAGGVNANIIGCGPGPAAAGRRAKGVNAWRYVYAGEWPNMDTGIPGAWHGSEIGLVFGSTEFSSHRPDIPAEVEMSKKIRTIWTTFAKDPVHGLHKMGYPLYDAAGEYSASCWR